jgi:hypothetical protein
MFSLGGSSHVSDGTAAVAARAELHTYISPLSPTTAIIVVIVVVAMHHEIPLLPCKAHSITQWLHFLLQGKQKFRIGSSIPGD